MIYLNNAAVGFPKSKLALDAFRRTINTMPISPEAIPGCLDEYQLAREYVAGQIHVEKESVFFTDNATNGINYVLQGFLNPGDKCLIDNRSHASVIETLRSMPDVLFETVRLIDRDEEVNVAALVQSSPDLVCLTYVSNVSGSIYDIATAIQVIREHFPNTSVFIDACQAAGNIDLSLLSLADFAVFSGTKYLHAIPGAAVLLAKKPLTQCIFGGSRTPDDAGSLANHKDVGIPNMPAINALCAAMKENSVYLDDSSEHIAELTDILWSAIRESTTLNTIGRIPRARRVGIVSCYCNSPAIQSNWLNYLLSERIVIRTGNHSSPRIHKSLILVVLAA